MYNSLWYSSLIKPYLSPPDWLFQPVWIILYMTMILSLLLFIDAKADNKSFGYICFSLQLFFNLIWSPVFFLMKNIHLAFLVIILMIIFTILTIKEFYSVIKLAGIILIPYFLWILFAAYLNFGYIILN